MLFKKHGHDLRFCGFNPVKRGLIDLVISPGPNVSLIGVR